MTKLLYDKGRKLKDGESDYKPVLTVTIVPSSDQDPSKVGFAWRVIELTRDKMVIQLDFENATYISFEAADTLVIEFGDPDLFITGDGIQIRPEDRRIERKLMR